jgi:hypothetical protein
MLEQGIAFLFQSAINKFSGFFNLRKNKNHPLNKRTKNVFKKRQPTY